MSRLIFRDHGLFSLSVFKWALLTPAESSFICHLSPAGLVLCTLIHDQKAQNSAGGHQTQRQVCWFFLLIPSSFPATGSIDEDRHPQTPFSLVVAHRDFVVILRVTKVHHYCDTVSRYDLQLTRITWANLKIALAWGRYKNWNDSYLEIYIRNTWCISDGANNCKRGVDKYRAYKHVSK